MHPLRSGPKHFSESPLKIRSKTFLRIAFQQLYFSFSKPFDEHCISNVQKYVRKHAQNMLNRTGLVLYLYFCSSGTPIYTHLLPILLVCLQIFVDPLSSASDDSSSCHFILCHLRIRRSLAGWSLSDPVSCMVDAPSHSVWSTTRLTFRSPFIPKPTCCNFHPTPSTAAYVNIHITKTEV